MTTLGETGAPAEATTSPADTSASPPLKSARNRMNQQRLMASKKPGERYDWRRQFLATVLEHGGIYHAARVAGVTPQTVWNERERNPEFDKLVDEARQEHADTLERELRDMGVRKDNPVPHIVRLKALRPSEYIERHAVLSLNANADVSSDETRALLRAMLSDATPETRAALAPPNDEAGEQ